MVEGMVFDGYFDGYPLGFKGWRDGMVFDGQFFFGSF